MRRCSYCEHGRTCPLPRELQSRIAQALTNAAGDKFGVLDEERLQNMASDLAAGLGGKIAYRCGEFVRE